jgi:hypothetical protein
MIGSLGSARFVPVAAVVRAKALAPNAAASTTHGAGAELKGGVLAHQGPCTSSSAHKEQRRTGAWADRAWGVVRCSGNTRDTAACSPEVMVWGGAVAPITGTPPPLPSCSRRHVGSSSLMGAAGTHAGAGECSIWLWRAAPS